MSLRSGAAAWLLALALALASPRAAQAQEERQAPQERLEGFIGAHGDLTYAGLYSLPATQDSFLDATGDIWEGEDPWALAAQLGRRPRRQVVKSVARKLGRMTPSEVDDLFGRLESWVRAADQLRVCMGLTSVEQIMDAAFGVPLTRDLFDGVIRARGLDPKTAPEGFLGSTLSSGEKAGILYALLNQVSALSARDQVRYFRNLYDRLLRDFSDW